MNGPNIYPNEKPPPYSLHPQQNENLNLSNTSQNNNSQNVLSQNILPQHDPSQYFPPQQYSAQQFHQQPIPPQYIIIPPQVGNSNLPNYQSTAPQNQNEPNRLTNDSFDLCPICRSGTLIPRFTFLGLLLAIFLFPFGIVCLFILMKKHCTNCKISFSIF